MMTRVQEGSTIFVHASDIQLLDPEPVEIIRGWHPNIVMASGPPLYLNRLSPAQETAAWNNALALAGHTDTLILDHHLLRCDRGIDWLGRLAEKTQGRVMCAAAFMHVDPCFLEAWRGTLYEELPVPNRWHEAYATGELGTQGFRQWREWDLEAL